MSDDFKLGIIGGSGLEDPQFFKDVKEVVIDTPFGKPSDSYLEGNSSIRVSPNYAWIF